MKELRDEFESTLEEGTYYSEEEFEDWLMAEKGICLEEAKEEDYEFTKADIMYDERSVE